MLKETKQDFEERKNKEKSNPLEPFLGKRITCYGRYKARSLDNKKRVTILFKPLLDLDNYKLRDHNWFSDIDNKAHRKLVKNDWVRLNGLVKKYRTRKVKFKDGEYIEYWGSNIKLEHGTVFEILAKDNETARDIENQEEKRINRKVEKKLIGGLSTYQLKPILYKDKNINIFAFQKLLVTMGYLPVSCETFKKKIMQYGLLRKRYITEKNKKFKDLLFTFVTLSGRLFMGNFEDYCEVIRNLWGWNRHFSRQFKRNAPLMFNNMLMLRSPPGKNFPIRDAPTLKHHLQWFNSIEEDYYISPNKLFVILHKERNRIRRQNKPVPESDYSRAFKILLKL